MRAQVRERDREKQTGGHRPSRPQQQQTAFRNYLSGGRLGVGGIINCEADVVVVESTMWGDVKKEWIRWIS